MTELKQLHMQRDLRKPLPTLPPLDSAYALSPQCPMVAGCLGMFIESSLNACAVEQITRDTPAR